MEHILTIKGGRRHYYDAGSCSCGKWSKFLNRITLRGGITNNKKFIKREFKLHKGEAI